ncbi:hypothetical protein BKA70DRAFT_1245578 [Coprinopsis sp. MPI-PUGE-AT-0042]|nr:hypothetical protein BKA70DRAFT_1245578 [Coprinopsis sp. MPI-PUGE-AT-0042]
MLRSLSRHRLARHIWRSPSWQRTRGKATLPSLDTSLHTLYEWPLVAKNPAQMNKKLVGLLHGNMFAAARLLMDKMHELDVEVQQHPQFEKPALSALRLHRRDSAHEFAQWLQHAPDAHHPLATIPPKVPFSSIFEWIFLRGIPAKKLSFASEFGLLMASKGYHHNFVVEIARVIARFGSPERLKTYFVDAEQAALHYYAHRRRFSPEEAVGHGHPCRVEDPMRALSWYRQVAVEMCVAVKRFDEALFLLEQDRAYVLPDNTYERFLQALPQEASSSYTALISEQVKGLRANDARRRLFRHQHALIYSTNIRDINTRWRPARDSTSARPASEQEVATVRCFCMSISTTSYCLT